MTDNILNRLERLHCQISAGSQSVRLQIRFAAQLDWSTEEQFGEDLLGALDETLWGPS